MLCGFSRAVITKCQRLGGLPDRNPLPQFWRLDIRDPSVNSFGSFWRPRKSLSRPLPGPGGRPAFLPSPDTGTVASAFPSAWTSPPRVCPCLHFPLKDTAVILGQDPPHVYHIASAQTFFANEATFSGAGGKDS